MRMRETRGMHLLLLLLFKRLVPSLLILQHYITKQVKGKAAQCLCRTMMSEYKEGMVYGIPLQVMPFYKPREETTYNSTKVCYR
jgi:hypothetical protein